MRNYTRKFNFLSYSKFLLRKGSSLFCDHSKLEFLIFGLMCAAFLAWKREGGGGGEICYVYSCHILEKVLLLINVYEFLERLAKLSDGCFC